MTHGGTLLSAYDGVTCERLSQQAGAARLVAVDHCSSTMDLAHQLAGDDAPHGTVVVAESQGAGRGRSGKSWSSTRGAGVWASVLLRRPAVAPPGVLSLRVGLVLAEALDAHSAAPVQLKWPNDLLIGGLKVAGVLAEARWRGTLLEWIVVGVGVNVRAAGVEIPTATLGPATRCGEVLVAVVRSVLDAGNRQGALTEAELAGYARRDVAVGRAARTPLEGIVLGISSAGALRVRTAAGDAEAVSGSLVFSNPLTE